MRTAALDLVGVRRKRSLGAPLGGPTLQNAAEEDELQFWRSLKQHKGGKLPTGGSLRVVLNPDPAVIQGAVAGGPRVELFSFGTSEEGASSGISGFREVVRCIDYRRDGKLLAVADNGGSLRLVDLKTRHVLRRYRDRQNTAPLQACAFSHDKVHVMAGGDDAALTLWSLSSTKECTLRVPAAHSDHVRCMAACPADGKQHQWATGSSDGAVKIWDFSEVCKESQADEPDVESSSEEASRKYCLMEVHHGAAVTSVRFLRNATRLATAGGHVVKIWDIEGNPAKMVATIRGHLKTVTDIGVSFDGKFIATASGDRTVKFFSTDGEKFELKHSLEFTSPVTSVQFSHVDFSVAIGMSDGSWQVRRHPKYMRKYLSEEGRKLSAEGDQGVEKGWPSHLSGGPRDSDVAVRKPAAQKHSQVDYLLRTFQYQLAMDRAVHAFEHGDEGIHGLVEELIQRGGLEVACRGRDETNILPILGFINRSLGFGDRGTGRVLELAGTLLAENEWLMHTPDQAVKQMLQKISTKLSFELSAVGAFREVASMLELSGCHSLQPDIIRVKPKSINTNC